MTGDLVTPRALRDSGGMGQCGGETGTGVVPVQCSGWSMPLGAVKGCRDMTPPSCDSRVRGISSLLTLESASRESAKSRFHRVTHESAELRFPRVVSPPNDESA